MRRPDGGTTNPSLLGRLGDWADHEAWFDFLAQYDPLIASVSRKFRFDPETSEEYRQRLWIELARRMRTYRYDPGGTFRGWLRRLCHSRAVDLLRQRGKEPEQYVEDDRMAAATASGADEGEPDAGRPELLERARAVQEAVQARVDPRTWGVFWDIAVQGCSVRDAAQSWKLTYAAAFAAQKRVGRMLREEGRRLEPGAPTSCPGIVRSAPE